ncbi:MAG TPA: O-antigen ligase family protein [Allosphingosinicella sp.]|nr:O-antigen ligase family protein [Allosphingosinicella sp.]
MASAPAPAPYAAIRSPVSAAAFASLLLLIVLAQLDAVGNRLSVGLPYSLYTLLYTLTAGLALLSLYDLRGSRLAGTSAIGARLTACLLLWGLVAWTLAEHQRVGWEYLVDMSAAMGLLFLVAALADTEERVRTAIWAMILSGLASALIVYGDYLTGQRLVSTSAAAATAEFGGVARSAGGSDQNPTTAAQMLMVSAGLLLGLMVREPSRRLAAAAILLLCLVALGIMAARSAVIGLIAIAALVLLSLRHQRGSAIAVAALLGLLAVGLALAPPELAERFLALGDWSADPTLYRRVSYLRAGAELFADSPIWGVGPGNFPLYFAGPEFRFLPGREPVPRELHNTYADVAVELGIVGFLLFIALIAIAWRSARRAAGLPGLPGSTGFAIWLALSGLLVACLFMPHKDMRYLWILLALALQSGRLAMRREAER